MTRNCMANALISSYAKIMSISNLLSTNSVHLYVKEYKFGFSIFWYDSQISYDCRKFSRMTFIFQSIIHTCTA